MIDLDVDVGIIGGGFGGSVTALVLDRIGIRPAVIDRGRHPRFAIGESSTPLADLALTQIARRYDLPRLAPLARYGTWQATYPEVACGLKRGFCYFQHQEGKPFAAEPEHSNELVVAASADDGTADTHWYRPDFDRFLFEEARQAGIPCFDQVEMAAIHHDGPWLIEGMRGDQPLRVRAKFLVDASGDGCVLARRLGISTDATGMRTRSRAILAHFGGVRPWREIEHALGGRVEDHPFGCDDSALHHILDGGWMYVLRFNNGITSAGFALDMEAHPPDVARTPAEEWAALMGRYPSVAEQFAEAQIVAPEGGLRQTGRLQRRAGQAAGEDWAMLPATAGILDPLHSTGNAHTLAGIERLARAFEQHWQKPGLRMALNHYSETVLDELTLIDTLVHGCYLAFGNFDLVAAFSMWYFAAATMSEERKRQGRGDGDAYLQAHDPTFRQLVEQFYQRLADLRRHGPLREADAGAVAAFVQDTAVAIAPYNCAGLCDPAKKNMYPFPASATPR
jgi:FADH2 O2-dependent halogenase